MAKRVNRRGAARREAIIDAAIELWSSSGWRGTGITAVAERAGVTHAGLLHHFGTKENLLLEVVAEEDRRNVARLADMFEPGGLDTLRRLPDIARVIDEHRALSRLHLVLQVENLDADGPAHDYYMSRQRFLRGAFADAVGLGQDRGEIRRDVEPRSIAAQILAFLEGANLQRQLDPAAIDIVSLCEDFTSRLLRDLAA